MAAATTAPLVLLIEPSNPIHQHAQHLAGAGFVVATLPLEEVMSGFVAVQPAVIAVELDPERPEDVFKLAWRLRADQPMRAIPVIVYGHGLSADDIERAARGGAMWLQLEPADGNKLVAAIRGVLAAAQDHSDIPTSR